MVGGEIATLKVQVARHRCEGLSEEVKALRNKEYSSQGSNRLLEFVGQAAQAVLTYLDAEEVLPGKELLTEDELEGRVHRVTELIPLLHTLLGLVEGSDTSSTPTPLVLQLRRFAKSIISDSEVVVSAKPILNYSIQEIASELRSLLDPTPLKHSSKVLPQFLFVISIPRVESTEVLLHCILSHELGHGLYEKHGLAGRLLPQIKINEGMIKAVTSTIVSGMPGTPPPMFDIEVRNSITQLVTGRIDRWVRELCSDAFGIQLFGPAYYFSFIYFSLAFAQLDQDSESHPPPRLRLRLMSRIINRLYSKECFKAQIFEFLQTWTSISGRTINCRDEIAKIALDGIEKTTVLDSLDTESESCLDPTVRYIPTQHKDDMRRLGELLISVVPPGETHTADKAAPTDLPLVLNAGWDVFLSDLASFKSNLSEREASSDYQVRRKLQKVLLKALEIAETRRSWEETRDAIGL